MLVFYPIPTAHTISPPPAVLKQTTKHWTGFIDVGVLSHSNSTHQQQLHTAAAAHAANPPAVLKQPIKHRTILLVNACCWLKTDTQQQ
jgi:hypothetical protein